MIEITRPSHFATNAGGDTVESDSQFEVGLALDSRPRGHLGEGLTGMRVCDGDKTSKGGKEMVFAGFRKSRLRIRMEITHRERVDHCAIQHCIGECVLRRHNVARLVTRRFGECQRLAIDAQLVLHRIFDVALRIDCADQVIV